MMNSDREKKRIKKEFFIEKKAKRDTWMDLTCDHPLDVTPDV